MAKRSVKNKPQQRWDRNEFADVHEKSPEERLERAIVRYRKQRLFRGKQAQIPDTTATIIPFPSEQAQAADGSDDPPGDA